jgi:hypothetical protein
MHIKQGIFRGVSKAYLRKILQFVDTLITKKPPLIAEMNDTPETAWVALATLSACDWLRRYQTVMAGDGPTLTVATFRNHMHILHRLHCKVLQTHTACPIPLPITGKKHGRSPFAGVGTSGDESSCIKTRSLMLGVRSMMCKECNTTQGEQRHVFEPREIQKMIGAAVTTSERLIVWLFLTTGLTIGGLSRLQAGDGPYETAGDVPHIMTTTEKNNRERCIDLGPTGRMLVSRWYCEDRRMEACLPSLYLFPSPTKKDQPVSTHWLWFICRRVFVRAGLLTSVHATNTHLQPCTFRHTVIHGMHMCGSSFRDISKFIGHTKANFISTVYSQLHTHSSENGVERGSVKEWLAVKQLLCDPWL